MSVSSFLGLPFKSFDLEDQSILQPFLQTHVQSISGYSFACLASWNGVYHYAWHLYKNHTLLISCQVNGFAGQHLLQPVGLFDEECKQWLVKEAQSLPYPLQIFGVSDSFINAHHSWQRYVSSQADRNASNYIYTTNDLAHLAGHKYAKKRNLLSQAEQLYHYEATPLTENSKEACLQILTEINTHSETPLTESLSNERIALNASMQHFATLQQQGILISIDNKPVAFSIFEALNHDTAVIHFEKAERHYKGLYQVVNLEAARAIERLGFTYINREEDLGIEGLRQAKQSYFPIALHPVYTMTFLTQPLN